MWLVTCICRYKFALNKARSEINYKLAMFLHICCFPLQPAKPLVEVLQLPVDGGEVACKDLLHLLVDLDLSSLISIFLLSSHNVRSPVFLSTWLQIYCTP